MPVFNSEDTVSRSICSILSQDYSSFELIIIDDGSTDSTPSILNRFSSFDPRVKVYTQYNCGLTVSLNRAFEYSSGSIILRHDADDYSHPCRFSSQVYWINQRRYDFCASRTYIQNLKRISPRFSYYIPKKAVLLFENPFIHGSLAFTRECLKSVNLYDPSRFYAQDYDLIIRLLMAQYRYKFLSFPFYVTTSPPSSISIANRSKQLTFARLSRSCWRSYVGSNLLHLLN
jgi:glycosyltransferase involved in cell wall biosynthesis